MSDIDELPIREQIRIIWRPLYELGYKGAEQVDAQYMAMLISSAVTETQELIDKKVRDGQIEELKPINAINEKLGDDFGEFDAQEEIENHVNKRLRELKEE